MTTMEWLNKQQNKIKSASEIATKKAAIETHRQMGNRIFKDGKNSNDASIGKYNDTDPIYVNPKNSPRKFTPLGKPKEGKKRGSSYKEVSYGIGKLNIKRDTRWFESYRAFRAFIGRESSKVNLNLFGLLQSDYINGFSGSGLEYTSVLKNIVNQKKREGLEKRFGAKIFSVTDKERKLFIKLSSEEFKKIMTNAK